VAKFYKGEKMLAKINAASIEHLVNIHTRWPVWPETFSPKFSTSLKHFGGSNYDVASLEQLVMI
jgi:hypothetical protein